MPFRTSAAVKVQAGGRPYTVTVLDNPTIDDILVVEMQVQAFQIAQGETLDRRVGRDVRDVLIRLGVER